MRGGAAPPGNRPHHQSPRQADTQRSRLADDLRRRRDAARRLPPLECGCRDPWTCRCHELSPALDARELAAWSDAARHVAIVGVPILPAEVLRALWRRGGDDRALAEHIHDLGGAA